MVDKRYIAVTIRFVILREAEHRYTDSLV